MAKLWHRCAPPPSPFAPKHDNVPVGDPLPSGVPKPADTTEARTSPDIPNHFFRQWSPHAPSACVLQRHFSQLSIWCTHDELHFFLPIHFDKNLSSSQLIPPLQPSPSFSSALVGATHMTRTHLKVPIKMPSPKCNLASYWEPQRHYRGLLSILLLYLYSNDVI